MALHLQLISRAISDAVRGIGPDVLLIEAPPRHGKSELVSKYTPAWFLNNWPNKRVILASYEANIATNWGRRVRSIMTDFADRSEITISPDKKAAGEWDVDGYDGGMLTTGVGGPMTGRGADLMLIDDPIKNAEEAMSETIRERHWDWWQSTASTRLEPGGVTIVMATRWHKDDLTGRLLAQAENGEIAPIRRISLPAIAEDNDILGRRPGDALWPDRWPIEALMERQRKTDLYWWNALYQQRPTQHGRAEWPAEYFESIDLWDHNGLWPQRFDSCCIAIDPSKGKDAKRGDYSAIVFVGLAGGVYHVDCSIRRRPVTAIVEDGIKMARQYPTISGLGIESNAFQDLLKPEFERVQRLRGGHPLPLCLIPNTISKELRISSLGPLLAQQAIRFRPSDDNRQLIRQLREFPLGDHDDGPDALEMAIRLLRHKTAEAAQGHAINRVYT